jgi:hypothetical protein
MFYRINKTETIKFELVSIERRVLDPVAPAPIPANPFRPLGNVSTIPQEVPATNLKRNEVLDASIQADQKVQVQALQRLPGTAFGNTRFAAAGVATAVREVETLGTQTPLADEVREAALRFVDAQLTKQGLLTDVGGKVSPQAQEEFGYTRTTSLPTAGVIVKSCMDSCGICEPAVERREELELHKMELQNKLLEKQIELLEKSQEYRCCPAGESDNG